MASRLFQSIIHQTREVIDRTVGILDENQSIVACSDLTRIGEIMPVQAVDNECFTKGGYTYRAFGTLTSTEYIIFVEGEDAEAEKTVSLMSVMLTTVKQFHDEKYDRASFIKNLLLENILSGDIYLKARELRFTNEVARVVILVRVLSQNDVSAYDILQNIFPNRDSDFVISMGKNDVAVVKETHSSHDTRDLEKLARSIVDTFSAEFYTNVSVSIGTVVDSIKDLSRSYKDARIAHEIGKVFDTEKPIISYDNLGIARLIYQLPTTLCETFLREVFKRGSIESLDQETLFTIQKFFENNLNVSETSRKLFVHRNTLVYRLEKIKKLTGLDLREFDHAIVFKIALMVRKYLISKPVKY